MQVATNVMRLTRQQVDELNEKRGTGAATPEKIEKKSFFGIFKGKKPK